MDALINWGVTFVAAHPKVAAWLVVLVGVDQVLKFLKNSFKLNIPDNVFDQVGDFLNAIISKVNPPKS